MLETRREQIAVLGGAPAIALLLYLLLASGGDGIETTAPAAFAAPDPAPAEAAAPSPAPLVAVQPQASLDGVTLHGIVGAGAILGFPDGRQRLVALGRDVTAGIALRELRQDRVVLAAASGNIELSFAGAQAVEQSGSTPPPSDGEARLADRSGAADAAARPFLLGTQPRRVEGRVTGYHVRAAASIPLLARAGLRAGDVLLSVNGQAIDGQERLTGIPAEIAGTRTVEVEFERSGQIIKTRVASQ